MIMPKIAMIDLDGVLNTYNGNFSEKEIPSIRKGAKEFLEELSKDFIIEIFTVRDKKITQEWLNKYQIDKYIQNITDKKNPKSSIFIDDRCLCFKGDFKKTLEQIRKFKPYWK